VEALECDRCWGVAGDTHSDEVGVLGYRFVDLTEEEPWWGLSGPAPSA